MKFNLNTNNRINKPEFPDKARKDMALFYLAEALNKQEYENCAELINTAKYFGAKPSEIGKVIANYLNRDEVKRNEAYMKNPGRRRF
jgi:hypothetical protein